MNRAQFAQRLKEQPLLLDGAMGTELHTHGVAFERCFDALNLDDPAVVAGIHRRYLDAGADVLETNTFGANRFRLAEHSREGQCAAINAAGVDIARRVIESAFKPVLLAGSVGPLGVRLAPLGRVTPEQAQAAFAEQIQALVYPEGHTGVDLLIIETMSDIFEVKAAVRAARAVSAEIPIIAMMSFGRDDRTLLGNDAADAATRLARLDVDAIGVNCSSGPAQLLRLLTIMSQVAPTVPLAAVPNAGWPEQTDGGRVLYPATPAYFGDYARTFIAAGARIVGGCCGTNSEHITAMRYALDNVGEQTIPVPTVRVIEEEARSVTPADPPTRLAQALESGTFITTVEMRPPKGVAAQKMLAGAQLLKESGATFLNVADAPLARMRMSAWAAAFLIQQNVGLETVLHFPVRGRNLLRIQGDLLAAHSMGVRNLFVTMGDPAKIGDYPDAMDSYDIVPTGLLELITAQFNRGVDKSGSELDQATNFTVGAALSLEAKEPEKQIALLAKKLRNGAMFALTQPIFNPERAQAFIAAYEARHGEWTLPIIAGIQPLYNSRNAEFLHNEVPGITIPEAYRERMRQAADPQAEGVAIAAELIEQVRPFVQGIYVIPAFGRYDLAAAVLDTIKTPVR